MSKLKIQLSLIFALLISVIPVFIYLIHFRAGHPSLSVNLNDWYLFNAYVSGFLGSFFSLLTLLVTLYIADSLNKYEKRKDAELKRQEDIGAYLEYLKYLTGAEFREKRKIGWQVLARAIRDKLYATFQAQESFVIRHTNRISRDIVFKKFNKYYTEEYINKKEMLHQESEDRHKLDSVINFFELLAIKDIPKDNYKVCDFCYDRCRPMLIWYAKLPETTYSLTLNNEQYHNPPSLRLAIEALDRKYYHPKISDTLTFDTIAQHPSILYLSKTADNAPHHSPKHTKIPDKTG